MNSPTPNPLASVIVRTTGRASLEAALASAAAQHYRPLEVVLVDAAGSGRLQATRAGDLEVRVVERGALARAAAANAGLEAAKGDWIIFLDDDDRIEPGHVGGLRQALLCAPGARVAYSQTRLLDAAGNPVRVFGGPFDRLALFRSNYLAIHAVLFSRAFVDEGMRFDEGLAMFEDWDFWLKLCLRTRFAFVPSPTAIYHAAAGESGAGSGANLDREALARHREVLRTRWAGTSAQLVQKARHAEERAARLAQSGRQAEAASWLERARAIRSGELSSPA